MRVAKTTETRCRDSSDQATEARQVIQQVTPS